MKGPYNFIFLFLFLIAGVLSGCKPQPDEVLQVVQEVTQSTSISEGTPVDVPIASLTPALKEFRLETQVMDGRMVFVGIGGEIDGVVNPDLSVQPGDTVRATLVNGDGIPHDLSFPDFMAKSALVSSKGKATEVSFTIGKDQTNNYPYFCTQPGHRQAGQEGKLIVGRP
jgi:nitrite reductase (NO-forming)